MRFSVNKNDPGYDVNNIHDCKIYFNGYEISDVITVDEEEGYLIRYCTTEKGKYILDYKTKELKTEIRKGTVRILLKGIDY